MKIKFLESLVAFLKAENGVERKAHELKLQMLIQSLKVEGYPQDYINLVKARLLKDISAYYSAPTEENKSRLKYYLSNFPPVSI
jgi:hypothetical protein